MEKEVEERIGNLAKRYQSMKILSPDLTGELTKIRGEIDTEMRALSPEEQNMFTHNLRKRSIAVNGQEPQTHTGYGVVRDVFCDILVDRLSEAAQFRYNLIQNGLGSSKNAQDITASITNTMMSLPNDQFEVFTRALNSYVVPTENKGVALNQSAINRMTFGIEEVRSICDTVTAQRMQMQREGDGKDV